MPASKHQSVRPKPIRNLRVVRSAAGGPDGRPRYCLDVGSWRYRCSIGRSGTTRQKREGDGCTPLGRFSILSWKFRSEGVVRARPAAPWRHIRADDGWCDDSRSGVYNKEIKLPSRRGHERMWRDDRKYDAVGIMDYNIRERKLGFGSAIFFHICGDEFESTAGCVALNARDMQKILPRLAKDATLIIA
ncbi:MAG: L,D-transpeptidase family protein [Rhodoblastus sp.]